jgi:putative heme-binding domain-containing protein
MRSPGTPVTGRRCSRAKGNARRAHRVNGHGSRFGPDLSDVAQFRRASKLERSVLDPVAEIRPEDRSYQVVTRDGATITGRLLNHDTFTVQLIDAKEQLRSFFKSGLREHGFVVNSPMPSYWGKLSAEELADLVRYLVSLKVVKAGNP